MSDDGDKNLLLASHRRRRRGVKPSQTSLSEDKEWIWITVGTEVPEPQGGQGRGPGGSQSHKICFVGPNMFYLSGPPFVFHDR